MIILAVVATTPSLGIAMTRNGVTVDRVVLPPSREHLENLAITIKEMTERTGIPLRRVDGFGVATGPGSFSGIRVGLATVKGMALALGKPMAGVSTLEVLAWEALADGEPGAPVIDARRGRVYTAVYLKKSHGLETVTPPMLVGTDEFAELVADRDARLVLCGDRTFDSLLGLWGNLTRSPVEVPSPCVCALLAQKRIQDGHAGGVHGTGPLYIMRSDAEENKERRSKNSAAATQVR